MKYLSIIWNVVVVVALCFVLLMFQHHLIWNPLALYRDHFDEYAVKGIINGPVYVFLFCAVAMHCSTLYLSTTKPRIFLLAAFTALPLAGMAFVVYRTGWEPEYLVPGFILTAAATWVVFRRQPVWFSLVWLLSKIKGSGNSAS